MGGQGPGWEDGSRVHCPLSKKFLWEELELVREEVTFIYQKLRECPEPTAGRGVLLWPCPPESPPPTETQEEEIDPGFLGPKHTNISRLQIFHEQSAR